MKALGIDILWCPVRWSSNRSFKAWQWVRELSATYQKGRGRRRGACGIMYKVKKKINWEPEGRSLDNKLAFLVRVVSKKTRFGLATWTKKKKKKEIKRL